MSRTERYFEDYEPGLVVTGGPVAVSEAEILDFARRYDPQPAEHGRGGTPPHSAKMTGTAAVAIRRIESRQTSPYRIGNGHFATLVLPRCDRCRTAP